MPITSQRLRASIASLIAAGLLVGLAACAPAEPSASPSPSQDQSATWVDVCATGTGDAVESITVTGAFLEEPTVEFDAGLATDTTERRVIGSGDGASVEEGDLVSVAYAMYRGSTAELIEAHGFREGGPVPFEVVTQSLMPGLLKTLGCAETGTRVVSAITPADAFGEEGFSDPDGSFDGLEIAPNETLVVVMDVVRVLDRAWGVDQPAVEGMPEVTLIAEGQPVVTIPDAPAPTELQVAVLKKGDGPVVPESSTILVQYLGVEWDTNDTFDSSWARGQPSPFPLDNVIEGFAAALTGQTVGSQILVVIPPELGYGTDPDAPGANDLTGKTLVFVVDILYLIS